MFTHEKRSLGDLFNTPVDGKTVSYFQVPMYQRKYQWEKEKQVSKLIDDVFENFGKTYFMGPLIVCLPSKDSKEENSPTAPCLELIDGQQRLATLAIFIRALADYIQKRKKDTLASGALLDEMNKVQYQLSDKIVKGGLVQKVPVIQLSRRINPFFRDQIVLSDNEDKANKLPELGKGQHPSIEKLTDAYMKIWEALNKRYGSKTGDELLLELRKLAISLLNEKLFLVIGVTDESAAYTIFETINYRGKPLTLSDLVKNLCFKKMESSLSPEILEEFESDWDEAELLVSDFAAFMWHAWVSRYKSCPKSEVFAELQKLTKGMDGGGVFDLATDLVFNEVKYYHCYENPHEEQDEEKRRCLQMLRAMDATRCFPLLLSIDYTLQVNEAITAKDYMDILRSVTNLTFWHSGICNRDAKKLEETYHDLARKARTMNKETSSTVKKEIIEKLRKEVPSLEECRGSFVNKGFSDRTFVKMVLKEIENAEYQKLEMTLKGPKDVTLEHILPKSPDESWNGVFKDKKEMNEYTYKFGNYTLLWAALNKTIKNGSFTEKKKKGYAASKVGLTKALTKIQKWNAKAIDKRGEELFALAQKVWPLDE